MPNYLDLIILLLAGLAVARGYRRGFIVEFCSFTALWAGAYAALIFSREVAEWVGLPPERSITAFLLTFLLVIMLVHLLARALTALIDLAQLGFANKIAGMGAALLRSVFTMSIALNLLLAWTDGGVPPVAMREGSALAGPLRAAAPMLLPPLRESKWVKEMLEDLRREAEAWREEMMAS